MEIEQIVKVVLATVKHFSGNERKEESLNNKIDELSLKINQLEKKIEIPKPKRKYKKRRTSKTIDRKVTIVKNLDSIDSKVFGVRTHTKTNSKIEKALKSNRCRFTAGEIIAEVKRKHPVTREWSGKELLRQIKLAKGRLDSNRRRAEGVGVYAVKNGSLKWDLPKK